MESLHNFDSCLVVPVPLGVEAFPSGLQPAPLDSQIHFKVNNTLLLQYDGDAASHLVPSRLRWK
eukprot:5150573-Amphidinium_carterae.1